MMECVVYASTFGETRALESYLDSFPGASPTLFQTSIHPSAVQQGRVVRQKAVREFFPVAGGQHLVLQALLTALLEPTGRSILCGGEERGSWLRERGLGATRTFGFAATLGSGVAVPAGGVGAPREDTAAGLGRIRLSSSADIGILGLPEWFDLLHGRRAYSGPVGPGWRLELTWGT
jgi:hypothetical protein